MCIFYNAKNMKGAICPIVVDLLLCNKEKLNTR